MIDDRIVLTSEGVEFLYCYVDGDSLWSADIEEVRLPTVSMPYWLISMRKGFSKQKIIVTNGAVKVAYNPKYWFLCRGY
jgi:hypothetical protein